MNNLELKNPSRVQTLVHGSRSPLRPHGLRPTIRHQMILVAHFAVLITVVGSLSRSPVLGATLNAPVTALLLSPWILAILILVLDRPGPLKYWLAPVLLMLFAPLVAVSYDVFVVRELVLYERFPRLVPTLLINGLFLPAFALFWIKTSPTRCPACGDRSLIPLMHPWGQSKRTVNTRWCASCGSSYWRNRGEDWRRERRTTRYEE